MLGTSEGTELGVADGGCTVGTFVGTELGTPDGASVEKVSSGKTVPNPVSEG